MSKKVSVVFQIALVLIVIATHLYAATAPAASVMNFYKTDDAYYYFIVARNVAEGHGFTFDLINRTNGYHPLWLFINIPIFALTGSSRVLPLRVIIMVMAILTSATGLLIFRLLRKYINHWVAAFAATAWVLFPRIHQVTTEDGLEAGLNAFSLILLLFAASWYRDRMKEKKNKSLDLFWVGLVASLVLFTRLDNIFTVILVGAWLLLRDLPIQRQFILDEIFIAIGVIGSAIMRFGISGEYTAAMFSTYVMLILAMIIKPIVFTFFQLDTPWIIKDRRFQALKIIVLCGLASLVLGAIMLTLSYFRFFSVFPRTYIIYDWIITTVLLICSRIFFKHSLYQNRLQVFSAWLEWLKSYWGRFIREGFTYFGLMAVLMIAYLTWNTIYFGTAMPISGQIKHWWAELPNTVYGHDMTLQVFLGLSPNSNYGSWSLISRYPDALVKGLIKGFQIEEESNYWIIYLCIVLVAIIFIARLIRNRRSEITQKFHEIGILPLFFGCLVQISYYNATNYPNTRSWYWVGEILVILLIIGLLLDTLADQLDESKSGGIVFRLIMGCVIIFLIGNNISYIKRLAPARVKPELEEYFLADARGLETYTHPGAVVGMTGGGTVAYFVQNRTIVNLDGLMNSVEYFNALKEGTGSEFLDEMGVEYIFATEYMVTSSDPYMGMFKDRLERIGKVRGPEGFTLFKYLEPSEIEMDTP